MQDVPYPVLGNSACTIRKEGRMKRSAVFLGIVLAVVSASTLSSGGAMAAETAAKPAAKAVAKTGSDIGSEAQIYGPMTVRAVMKAPKPAEAAVQEEKCFECHDEIQALKKGGRHAKVNCTICHDGTADHLEGSEQRPGRGGGRE